MNKQNKFEDFLKERHAKDYHGTDDDMPDSFEKYLCELNIETLMLLADLYGADQYILALNKVKEMIPNKI